MKTPRSTIARFPRVLATAAIGLVLVAASVRAGAPTTPGKPAAEAPPSASDPAVPLPNAKGSLKFAVLGDFGTGERPEYELATRMAELFTTFKLEVVILVGDNLIGPERPEDFKLKFEDPYKPLLDGNVKFYAALGNHDARAQVSYKPFHMGGNLYYSFQAPRERVRFFMLDTTYPSPEEIAWVEKELKASSDDWKIVAFHHPLYSSGGRHGSDLTLRGVLEPLFVKYGVSVVLTGHDHFYERIKPQHDIVHFVVGSGGRLAPGDIDKHSNITAKGFDTDQAFMAVEISGDTMTFNAISREGRVVDSGTVRRRLPQ